jgi:hypothetical protein
VVIITGKVVSNVKSTEELGKYSMESPTSYCTIIT